MGNKFLGLKKEKEGLDNMNDKLIEKVLEFEEKDLIRERRLFYNFGGRGLCAIEREMLENIRVWRNSQIEILRQTKPLTAFNQEEWFQKISKDKGQTIFSLFLLDKNNKLKEFIGYCGLVYIDYDNRNAELSFVVNPKRCKDAKTYEKDCLAVLHMLCRYGFEEINLNKIFTETFPFRKKHMKILEKFGFKKERNLIKNRFSKEKSLNSLIHSVLLTDWKSGLRSEKK